MKDVFTIFNGYAFSSDKSADLGVKWVKIADVGIQQMKKENLSFLPYDYKEKFLRFSLKKGDYVVALTRPILNGKLKIAQIDDFFDGALLNQRVGKIETDNSRGFIYCYLQREDLIKSIANNIAGSDPPNLSPNEINSIKLNIPSIQEQKKISSFLTLIDNRIQAQNEIISGLKSFKKGMSQKIFNQELRFKSDRNQMFPKWKIKKLSEIGEIITGKTPSTSNEDLWNGEIQFITPTDIDGNKYQLVAERTVKRNRGMKILPSKSILFTCIASIGKMSLSVKPCITNQQINSIIPFESYNNEFIFYALLNITGFIKSTQSSSTMPIINKTEFSRFKIALPCFEEQVKIANYLSSLDKKIEIEEQLLTQYQAQKKYLLQNLFI